MKTLFFATVAVAALSPLNVTLPFQVQPVVAGDNEGTLDIDVADIARLQVRLLTDGETGIGRLLTTSGANRYELDGTNIVLHVANSDSSVLQYKLTVSGSYGQVKLNATIVLNVKPDGEASIVLEPYVFDAIAAGGGGGDYKTDIYMDGDGRVMVERLEDGSTLLLDEHENPILKRNADGTTQYFDAYQSARLMIGEHGEVSVAYTEDETVKTLAIAEAILARTQKRLLYNTAGETTIKDAEGNVLTHADIYAMLMTSPDFVVLVRSDHAFHPNLVTPTQIAFTCSYLGADGQISAERVNITSEDVVTYTNGKGVTLQSNKGLAIGEACTANGSASFANGYNARANGAYSHAEGSSCIADGYFSHAEGYKCEASSQCAHAEGSESKALSNNSHAEGYLCTSRAGLSHTEGYHCGTGTDGGSAHAEGSYTNANGAASHTEGYRTITTEGGSHAQGCWNKSEGGQYAFMHGCGADEDNRKNAFLIAGDEVYMFGIGGYDGTNYGAEGVKSVQTVIRELQLKLINF